MVRVGLIGCGTIGSALADAVRRQHRAHARLVAITDVDPDAAAALRRRIRSSPPRIVELPDLVTSSDLVLEAASVHVSGEVAWRALRAHRDVLVMSVGGLLLDSRWRQASARSRGRLIIPSGALAGLDGVAAMAAGGGIRSVRLTTSKPPKALAAAPYVAAKHLSLEGLTSATEIFAGTPRQVVKAFPQNTNVAAALALAAGRAADRVRIRVVADPGLQVNRHEIDIQADCGRIQCRIESVPSSNPKTSELAVRSAVAALERVFARIRVGT